MATIEHPAWCDRALCTAPAELPAEFKPEAGQRHLSVPATLNLRVSAGVAFPAGTGGAAVAAQLYQYVAPWRCETGLLITDADGRAFAQLPLREAQAAATVLGGLLAAAAADTAAAIAADLAGGPVSEPR